MPPTLILYTLILFSNPIPSNQTGEVSMPIASHSISLKNRYGNNFVNEVFKDNILLTMAYLDGKVKSKGEINWEEIRKPFHYEFSLKPGERFVFHDKTLDKYKDHIVKMTNTHFNYQEGFKSDGYLTGDGVCHLASLFYWTAKDAGLEAVSPTNHDFAVIPEVPKEFGVSIFYADPSQNLYILNTKNKPATFIFDYKNDTLTASVY